MTGVQGPVWLGPRSTRKPLSSEELSLQVIPMVLLFCGTALASNAAAGGTSVVAQVGPANVEKVVLLPLCLKARTL